jgi:hypothetical protein
MPRVEIPSFWTSTGVPEVCARHGEPQVVRQHIAVASRPPAWAYLLAPLGGFIFALIVRSTRKVIQVGPWPFCARCRSRRTIGLWVGFGIMGAGAAMFASGFIFQPQEFNLFAAIALVGVLVVPVGLLVAILASWQHVSRAQASRDGVNVLIKRAHERFAARAAELAEIERAKNRAGSLFPYRAGTSA